MGGWDELPFGNCLICGTFRFHENKRGHLSALSHLVPMQNWVTFFLNLKPSSKLRFQPLKLRSCEELLVQESGRTAGSEGVCPSSDRETERMTGDWRENRRERKTAGKHPRELVFIFIFFADEGEFDVAALLIFIFFHQVMSKSMGA